MDETALSFSMHFYSALDLQNPAVGMDYPKAFLQAATRVKSCFDAERRKPAKHQAKGAVDFVCLLSKDGDHFPEKIRVGDGAGDTQTSSQKAATTRSAPEPPLRTQAPPPVTPSTRALTALDGDTDRTEVATEEAVDPELKALLVEYGLDSVCVDVCRGLKRMGVECLDDLKFVEAQDLNDELPKYVNLTLIQKRKVAAMIEGQRTASGGVALPTVAAPKASPLQQQSAPSQVPAPSSPLEISLQFLPSMGGI